MLNDFVTHVLNYLYYNYHKGKYQIIYPSFMKVTNIINNF